MPDEPKVPSQKPFGSGDNPERYSPVPPIAPDFNQRAEVQLAKRFPHFEDREAAKQIISKAHEKMGKADERMNEKIRSLETAPGSVFRPRGFIGEDQKSAEKVMATQRCKSERSRIRRTADRMLNGIEADRKRKYAETKKARDDRDNGLSKGDEKGKGE